MSVPRLLGLALLVAAFFVAAGAAVAFGNGRMIVGLLMVVAALALAVAGWTLWDRVSTRLRR